MAASVEFREEETSRGEIQEKENGDDLSVFIDLNERIVDLDLLPKSDRFSEVLEPERENPLMPKTISIMHSQAPGAEDLLDSEKTTTDYDWLLSPPRNPVPSPEMEEQETFISQHTISSGQLTTPDSTLENPVSESTSTTHVAPRPLASSNGVKPSSGAIRKATPTGSRPTLPSTANSLRSSTPTSRATVAATKAAAPPKRTHTPTSRATVAAMKPTAPPNRSTTPTRPMFRSSTPTTRKSTTVTTTKPTSRSSTPTPRSSNPSVSGVRSSSASKSRVKSRPSKSPLEMPELSTKTPTDSKKPLPERPSSTSRGRLPSAETKSIPKRSSFSPSRGQVSNGSMRCGVTRSTRGNANENDDVNPVLMGTKMVERVVNMRKLAPPKQDRVFDTDNVSGKPSLSQDNSGFGRTLSKKSFDMALRHLDIRRSMPGNMRAMITKIPASSVYSVRSEMSKTSDSPSSGAIG